MDPLNLLPSELVLQCLEHCLHDFPSLSRASRNWHELLDTPSLWWTWLTSIDQNFDRHPTFRLSKETILPSGLVAKNQNSIYTSSRNISKRNSDTSAITNTTLSKLSSTQTITTFTGSCYKSIIKIRAPEIFQNPKQCFKELRKLSSRNSMPIDEYFDENQAISLLMIGIEASSEDQGSQNRLQDISQTLNASTHTFWSSRGSPNPSSSEYLLYQLVQPACIITGFRILPFRATFQKGLPTYAPMWVRIKVGFRPEVDCMHYVSKEFKVSNINEWQYFPLGPFLIAGGYVRIEMRGRYETQPTDELYYTVLQQVDVIGYPLGALQELSNIQPALLKLASIFQVNWKDWKFFSQQSSSTSSTLNILQILNQAAAPILSSQKRLTKLRSDIENLMIRGEWEWSCDLLLSDYNQESGSLDHTNNNYNGGGDGILLRTDSFLKKFKSLCEDRAKEFGFSDTEQIWKHYLNVAVAKAIVLTNFEALELAQISLKQNSYNRLWNLIASRRIECTAELGDLFFPTEPEFASFIYMRGHIFDKVLDCLIVRRRYMEIIDHMQSYIGTPSEVTPVEIINKMLSIYSYCDMITFACELVRQQPLYWNELQQALKIPDQIVTNVLPIEDVDNLQKVLLEWAVEMDC